MILMIINKNKFLKFKVKCFLQIYEKQKIIDEQKELNNKLEKDYLNQIKLIHNRYLNEIYNLKNQLNFYKLKHK